MAGSIPLLGVGGAGSGAGILQATPLSDSQIDVTFAAPFNSTLQRSTDGAIWSTIQTPLSPSTVFHDTGLSAGTTYYYRVLDISSAGLFAITVTATNGVPVLGPFFLGANSL